ncbi:MAG: hypothetical protein R3C11_20980 [Planctomycetaceae bacterium]
MDLRFCPECKQSVLDDDAEECPFCGASMTGGSSSPKKTASPPVKKRGLTPRSEAKPPTPSPGSNAGEKKPAPPANGGNGTKRAGFLKEFGGASEPENDSEIFNFDTTRLRKAFPLRPKPQRGCTYRIVCPMCETAGFAPHKFAGKEVRCRNKECMVPVFEAPKVGGDQRKSKQEESKSNPILVVSVVTALVVLLGGGLWYWFTQTPSSTNLNQPNNNLNTNNTTTNETSETEITVAPTPKQDPFAPRKEVLAEAKTKLAQNVGNYTLNRSLADCRRMSAEIHAMLNETEKMEADLAALQNVGRQYPYYAIPALVEQSWHLLKAGDSNTLTENLTRIKELMKGLPNRGRFRLECAIRVGALAYATDNQQYANELAQKYDIRDDETLLTAAIYSSERLQTYDVDELVFRKLSLPWTSPFRSAITIDLVTRYQAAAALDWAMSSSEDVVRSDCLVDWTRTLYESTEEIKLLNEENLQKIVSASKQKTHPIRIYAQLYLSTYHHSDKNEALNYLTQAETATAAYTVPESLSITSMKQVMEQNLSALPKENSLLMDMKAFAEIAHAESVARNADKSWDYLKDALQIGRSYSPNPSLTRDWREAFSNVNRLQLNLAQQLNINSGDPNLLIKFSEYDRKSKELHERAERRFAAQWFILARALEWGRENEIWQLLASNSNPNASSNVEPFIKTPLLQLLLVKFEEKKQQKNADSVNELLNRLDILSDPEARLFEDLASSLSYDDVRESSKWVNESDLPVHKVELITIYFINRLIRAGKLSEAIEMNKRIEDDLLQEDIWTLMSGHAVTSGKVVEYWNLIKRQDFTPTKWVSICRGIIPELSNFLNFLDEESVATAQSAE